MLVKTRKLVADDLAEFKRLRLEALQTNPESFGSHYERELAYEDAKFAELIANNSSRFVWGAFDADKLVATMGLYNSAEDAADIVTIWGVYTSPQYRGKKISKQMILQIIADVKANPKISKIQLGVTTQSKAAIGLYKNVGFKTYKIEEGAIVHGDLSLCEVLMELSV